MLKLYMNNLEKLYFLFKDCIYMVLFNCYYNKYMWKEELVG